MEEADTAAEKEVEETEAATVATDRDNEAKEAETKEDMDLDLAGQENDKEDLVQAEKKEAKEATRRLKRW